MTDRVSDEDEGDLKPQSLRELSRELGLPEPDADLLSTVAMDGIRELRKELKAVRAERDQLLSIVRLYAGMGHWTAKRYIAGLQKKQKRGT